MAVVVVCVWGGVIGKAARPRQTTAGAGLALLGRWSCRWAGRGAGARLAGAGAGSVSMLPDCAGRARGTPIGERW
jgi:hypothetical protein